LLRNDPQPAPTQRRSGASPPAVNRLGWHDQALGGTIIIERLGRLDTGITDGSKNSSGPWFGSRAYSVSSLRSQAESSAFRTTAFCGVNPTCLQNVNATLRIFRQEGSMVIYPIPVAVTQAKVQLVLDETAKAPLHTINADVQNVVEAQSEAERKALLDRKA
jgi:hypothetical protein